MSHSVRPLTSPANSTLYADGKTSMNPTPAELGRAFNTAIVGSRLEPHPHSSGAPSSSLELMNVVESPAYRAILDAIAIHARTSNISLASASEEVIRTFRKVDALWSDYVYQLGVERLRGGNTPGSNRN